MKLSLLVGVFAVVLASCGLPGTAPKPHNRLFGQIVGSSSSQGALLFAGVTGTSASSDAWSWDGGSWHQLAGSTPDLIGAVAAQTAQGGILVFKPGVPRLIQSDQVFFTGSPTTFSFTSGKWTQLNPTASPHLFGKVSMAYNNTNHQDLLLGQAVGSTVELWVWDGKDWKKLWGGDSSAVGSPQYLAAMGNGEILGMGLATYEWLSGTWKLVTQQAPPQIAGNVSQDSAGHVLVYGAVDANNPYRTWLFDGSKWTSYASTPGSPGLIDGAMGYDSNHNQTLYFGGEQDLSSETLNSNNTWLWDATAHTWNQVG